MIGEVFARLLGDWSLGAGPTATEVLAEFASPRYFYDLFAQEAAEAWQGELPTVGWLYGISIVGYLAVLYYVWRRYHIVEQLKQGWAESRHRQVQAKASRAERRLRLEAAEAEAVGVSYEAFQALREGNRAFDEGRYAEALAAYEDAGRASPPLSAAWVGRGAALGRLGRHAEAREAFGHALALNPANAEALVNLGLTALATGDGQSAKSAFARAVQVDEACARGHYGLAVAAASESAKAEVLMHLKRALRLNPALSEAAASEPAFAILADDGCLSALLARFTPSTATARRAG